MSDFDKAVEILLKDESGGYVENDHGRGPSKWGVTLLTAQKIHPEWAAGDIKNLNRDDAKQFYKDWLWDHYHIGLLEDQSVASKIFDIAANIGPVTCIMILQHAVHVEPADGILGQQTALQVNTEDPTQVLIAFKSAGKLHYQRIAAANPELAVDLPGWIARIEA